jgi:hypothetical protein
MFNGKPFNQIGHAAISKPGFCHWQTNWFDLTSGDSVAWRFSINEIVKRTVRGGDIAINHKRAPASKCSPGESR